MRFRDYLATFGAFIGAGILGVMLLVVALAAYLDGRFVMAGLFAVPAVILLLYVPYRKDTRRQPLS